MFMKYIGSVTTDVGNIKKTNQDSLCIKVAETKRYGQVALAVVCDGMGGLSKGELASATVIRAFSDWFVNDFAKMIDNFSWEVVAAQWKNLIVRENQELLEYGKMHGVNLGTTLTAMGFVGREYLIAHVGDTRAYLINSGIKQLTEDQTFIAREIRNGRMTVEEAKTDSRKNMLLQCIGASREVTPDLIRGQVEENAIYMMCSDGFRHMISEQEMYEHLNPDVLIGLEQMNQKGRFLVDTVKHRNERDNISVLLIKTNS